MSESKYKKQVISFTPVSSLASMDFPKNLQPRSSSSSSSSSSSYIPPHRTQLHPRMVSLYSSPWPSPNPHANKHHSKCLVLLASLFTAPFFFYLFATARKIHASPKFADSKPAFSGLVIHAGPTASRISVFRFLGEGRVPFLDGAGSGSSARVRPGLLGFESDPDGVRGSILQLVEFAKRRVPKKEWGKTKVQLMAAEELEGLGAEVREKVLECCRQVLRLSGFLFKDEWARVIPGYISFDKCKVGSVFVDHKIVWYYLQSLH